MQPAGDTHQDRPTTNTPSEASTATKEAAAASQPQQPDAATAGAAAPVAVTSPRKDLSKRSGGTQLGTSDGAAAGRPTKEWDSSNLVYLPKLLPEPSPTKRARAAAAGGYSSKSATGAVKPPPTPAAAASSGGGAGGSASARHISEQLLEAKLLALKWMQQRDAIESGKAKELEFDTETSVDFILPSCQGAMFETREGYSVPHRHLHLMRTRSPRSLSPRLNSRQNSRCGTRESVRGANTSASGKKPPALDVPISTSAKEEPNSAGDAPKQE